MDKSQLAWLYVDTAIRTKKISRQQIINGIKGQFGEIAIYTDDLATYLDKHNVTHSQSEFEIHFKRFIEHQITDEEHATIISYNETPTPHF